MWHELYTLRYVMHQVMLTGNFVPIHPARL